MTNIENDFSAALAGATARSLAKTQDFDSMQLAWELTEAGSALHAHNIIVSAEAREVFRHALTLGLAIRQGLVDGITHLGYSKLRSATAAMRSLATLPANEYGTEASWRFLERFE